MRDAPADTGQGRRRAVAAASIGNLIEAYDLLIYGFLASILAQQFFPPGDHTAALLNTFAIFAVGFAVRPLGGLVFGHVGDRLGRRGALAISIVLMGLSTLAIGVLPTYRNAGIVAPLLLLLCRLAQGFSVGGEYVGANIFVLEHAAPGRAGRAASANLFAGYLGVSAASATSLVLAHALSPAELAAWGWRLPFLIAAPLALTGLYLRLRTPDSPAFDAARAARLRFPLGAALRTAKRGMLIYGGWLAMVSLGGFLLFGYMASYLIRVVGLDPVGAFSASLVGVLTVGAGVLIGGQLVDRYPLRLVAIGSTAGLAVTVLPGFLLIRQGGIPAAMAGQAVWALFVGMSASVGALLAVVLFPVEMRFTATAMAHNVATSVFGGTAPYVSAWLVANASGLLAPAWYVAVGALGGLAIAVLGFRQQASNLVAQLP
jgi:MHS family proline/betaine transporter-like MFS transporter